MSFTNKHKELEDRIKPLTLNMEKKAVAYMTVDGFIRNEDANKRYVPENKIMGFIYLVKDTMQNCDPSVIFVPSVNPSSSRKFEYDEDIQVKSYQDSSDPFLYYMRKAYIDSGLTMYKEYINDINTAIAEDVKPVMDNYIIKKSYRQKDGKTTYSLENISNLYCATELDYFVKENDAVKNAIIKKCNEAGWSLPKELKAYEKQVDEEMSL